MSDYTLGKLRLIWQPGYERWQDYKTDTIFYSEQAIKDAGGVAVEEDEEMRCSPDWKGMHFSDCSCHKPQPEECPLTTPNSLQVEDEEEEIYHDGHMFRMNENNKWQCEGCNMLWETAHPKPKTPNTVCKEFSDWMKAHSPEPEECKQTTPKSLQVEDECQEIEPLKLSKKGYDDKWVEIDMEDVVNKIEELRQTSNHQAKEIARLKGERV
jgi:hypothetical protein